MNTVNTVTIDIADYNKMKAIQDAFEKKMQLGETHLGWCRETSTIYMAVTSDEVVEYLKKERDYFEKLYWDEAHKNTCKTKKWWQIF